MATFAMKRAMLDVNNEEDDEEDIVDFKRLLKVFKICADHFTFKKVFNFLFRGLLLLFILNNIL